MGWGAAVEVEEEEAAEDDATFMMMNLCSNCGIAVGVSGI